jgi:transmembrane sensor
VDELIIRVIEGNASLSEAERVRDWRAQSAENDHRFRLTELVWSATAPSGRRSYAPPAGVDAIIGGGAPDGARAEPTVISLADRARARRARPGGLAWAAALAASLAAVGLGIRALGVPVPSTAPTATFVAEASDARTVVLDDGSFVRLSPGSRLDQWDADDERRLGLSGRAFFAVAHDPGRPFVVAAAGSEIRVLGTRFELAETTAGVRTVVVEGRVNVSNDLGRVDAPSGTVAFASSDEAPTARTVEDVHELLDWPEGLLVFQATPLAQVAAEVGRHFGRPVTVRGATLAELRISAFFESEGFEEVVQALCDVSGAECGLSEGGAVIGDGR